MTSGANRQSLDNTQYALDAIRHYEAVFGEDFVSPGGRAMAVELIARMALPKGSLVLDVGCGLGGSAFVMAREFGLQVDAIDLSNNMLSLASEKLAANGLSECVTFSQRDCLELNQQCHYDAIYSRDVFLHVADKSRLFSVLFDALKPGGRLLFTDYCCGEKPWREEFSAYVKSREYALCTVDEYARHLSDAGFSAVESTDWTGRFVGILQGEIERINTLDFSPDERADLAASWQGKIRRAESGDHRWGLFIATKP